MYTKISTENEYQHQTTVFSDQISISSIFKVLKELEEKGTTKTQIDEKYGVLKYGVLPNTNTQANMVLRDKNAGKHTYNTGKYTLGNTTLHSSAIHLKFLQAKQLF